MTEPAGRPRRNVPAPLKGVPVPLVEQRPAKEKSLTGAQGHENRLPQEVVLKDSSKPDGEAVNADNTLKDASELTWDHSPSQAAKRSQAALAAEANGERSPSPSPAPKRTRRAAPRIESEDEGDRAATVDTIEVHDTDNEEEEQHEPALTEKELEGNKKYWGLVSKDGNEPRRKSAETRDIRLCCRPDVRNVGGQDKPGHYCIFCLKNKKMKAESFFLGNVTALRKHFSRNHYAQYKAICDQYKAEAKAPVPPGWKEKAGTKQSTLDGTVSVIPAAAKVPLVGKDGIKEFVFEMLVDADLPFRFIDRASFRRLLLYIQPKLKDTDIPKHTTMANMVLEKVERLDEMDIQELARIPSRISGVWDGWSKKRRRGFTAFKAHYISSPPDNPNDWELKSTLLAFQAANGRHTGEAVGEELLAITRKFGIDKKFGWLVGDNVSSNDVAARHFMKGIKPNSTAEDAKEIRGRCIDHTIHLMCGHFLKAIGITGSVASSKGSGDTDEPDGFDVEVNMDIEPSPDDVEAILDTLDTDITPDTKALSRFLALLNQIRMSGVVTRDYLKQLCVMNGVPARELKQWVRTRWGSMADCLECVLPMAPALDAFCLLADSNDKLPPLRRPKMWASFKLSPDDWAFLRLVYNCLKIPTSLFNQLSNEQYPTCARVFPIIELLLSKWEALCDDPAYAMVRPALQAGIANMEKWYRGTDDTSIYFISHVLDPTHKRAYIDAAWDDEWVRAAMDKMEKIFLEYKAHYDKSVQSDSNGTSTSGRGTVKRNSWMEEQMKKNGPRTKTTTRSSNPLEELHRYFDMDVIPKEECLNPIKYWGHQGVEYPVLRMMARDYLAIPGSSASVERAFSFAARTDSPRRGAILDERFGGLQRLRDAYLDGRLKAISETWVLLDADFGELTEEIDALLEEAIE